MRTLTWLTALLLMLTTTGVRAAAPAGVVVEGVQAPAWVERAGGARDALAAGMSLGSRDRIYTGPDARALLRMADGSLIKLGENGVLGLDEIGRRGDRVKEVVTASLDVVSGAFRFTTQVLRGLRTERDVRVRIVTLTAGIRGTDLWGKADPTRDIVCLIEGRILVMHGNNAFTMDQPLSFYIAPRNAPPQPVAPVAPQQLEQWARETEIASGTGATRRGGRWRVYVAEADNQGDALAHYDRLRGAGYAAEIRPVQAESGIVYRVRISGLPSRQEAEALAGRLKDRAGVTQPRVSL